MSKLGSLLFFEHVGEYLQVYLPQQLGRSSHTIRSYRHGLNLFCKYMETEHHVRLSELTLQMISRDVVLAFLQWLSDVKGCSASSRNQRLACLKSFFKFVSDKDIAYSSAYLMIRKIPKKKEQKMSVQWIPENALHAILEQPNSSPKGIRDQMLMIMLYDTGARLSELLQLRGNDLDLVAKEPFVRLRGKGNKQRIVPLMEKTLLFLTRYCKLFHPNGVKSDTFLFYTVIKGIPQQMSQDNVEQLVQKYGKKAQEHCPQVPDRIYPHLFRHSRASHLYRAGIPLPIISRFLGHAQLSTTDIYASADVEMIRSSLQSISNDKKNPVQPIWKDNDEMLAKLCGLT